MPRRTNRIRRWFASGGRLPHSRKYAAWATIVRHHVVAWPWLDEFPQRTRIVKTADLARIARREEVLGGVQGGQPAQLELGKIDLLGEVKPGEVLGAIAATTAQQIEQHRGREAGIWV